MTVMPAELHPAVLTANDLADGAVVFWDGCGWVPEWRQARVSGSPGEVDCLRQIGLREEAANVVVGAYVTPVVREGRCPLPLLRRERIRALGPGTAPAPA